MQSIAVREVGKSTEEILFGSSPFRIDHSRIAMFAITAVFSGALMLWFYFDHGYPYWDAACHVLVSSEYRELLRHPHVLDGSWWHHFLTVNYCYAPQLHIWGGFLKVLFGNSLFSDHLSLVIFCAVLNLSTYKIAERLFKSRLTAFLCALVINCLPLVMCLSHIPLLDYPHLAMYSCAMLSLLWWRDRPTWKRTIVFGNILGMAVCAKQVASFFLIAPCLAVLILCLFRRRFDQALKLVVCGLIACLWLSTWVLPNYETMKGFTVRNNLAHGAVAREAVVWRNFIGYAENIPASLSPLLTVIFAATLLMAPRSILRSTWLFWLSTVVGVSFLSNMVFQNAEDRYMAPAYLWMALVCGYGISALMKRRTRQVRVLGLGIAILVIMQYTSFCFTPYPISNRLIVSFPNELGLNYGWFSYKYAPNIRPTPAGDPFGQEWIIDQIKSVDGNVATWFYIMPNNPRYNVHTFSLIALLKKCPVKPTTLRVFTMSGEEVDDTTNRVMDFHWYLFKSNNQVSGNSSIPADKNDLALLQLENLVRNSDKFYMVGQREVPDGSVITLYRQK